METLAAKCAEVRELRTGGEQRTRHQRTVAAELVHERVELDVRTFPGGAENPLTKFRDGRERREGLTRTRARRDRGDNRVVKTVHSSVDARRFQRRSPGAELGQRADFKIHQ